MWGDKTSLKSHLFTCELVLAQPWLVFFLIPLWTNCITVDRQTVTFYENLHHKNLVFDMNDPELERWEQRLLTGVSITSQQSGQRAMPGSHSWKCTCVKRGRFPLKCWGLEHLSKDHMLQHPPFT